jgi:uridine kinase
MAFNGSVVLRASLDDFKRPWNERHLHDRLSGEGYYRNAFDTEAIRRLLLEPAAPTGSGTVVLCSIDPLTQVNHSRTTVEIPDDGVLIVDGVFALRPALNSYWDLRVWLQIDPELSVRRGIARDAKREGGTEHAEALHRDRYLTAESIYVEEADPITLADMVIDNTDIDRPVLRRP